MELHRLLPCEPFRIWPEGMSVLEEEGWSSSKALFNVDEFPKQQLSQ